MKLNTKLSLKYWIALIGFCAIVLFIPYSESIINSVSKAISFDSTTLFYLIVAFASVLVIIKTVIGIKNILR